jgi:serine/threonine protein kinase
VYKGRWHSSDVAIKIVTVRAPEELPRVLREAEVMMQLDHPNIVRAFHASVWNPAEQVRVCLCVEKHLVITVVQDCVSCGPLLKAEAATVPPAQKQKPAAAFGWPACNP